MIRLFAVAANKDGVPGSGVTADKVELNPAYTISAALTYTAQLVNVLAFYLDIRLPRKQSYRYRKLVKKNYFH